MANTYSIYKAERLGRQQAWTKEFSSSTISHESKAIRLSIALREVQGEVYKAWKDAIPD